MIYGYARVSTSGQAREGNSLEEQIEKIRSVYPSACITEEAYSGAKERPAFMALLAKMQSGDTLVVTKLDRFCRTTKEGLEYIDYIRERGASVHILNMGLIENTPMGRMIVTMLLAFAEFERTQIIERTQGGKAIARQREGYREGRPRSASVEDVQRAKAEGLSVAEGCARLGISRSTWYRLATGT